MTANQIPEAAVDALYDELFRVGRYLHAPVPIDPKEIIRRHLTAAQQQRQAEPPSAPVGVEGRYHPCTHILIDGLKRLEGGAAVLAEWDRVRALVDAALAPPQGDK